MAHLPLGIPILFQGPIGRGCDHEMNAVWHQPVHRPSVAEVEAVRCWHSLNSLFNQFNEFLVFRDSRNIGLRVVERVYLCRNEIGKVSGPTEVWVISVSDFFQPKRQTHEGFVWCCKVAFARIGSHLSAQRQSKNLTSTTGADRKDSNTKRE